MDRLILAAVSSSEGRCLRGRIAADGRPPLGPLPAKAAPQMVAGSILTKDPRSSGGT
jgi:hypothetical protein